MIIVVPNSIIIAIFMSSNNNKKPTTMTSQEEIRSEELSQELTGRGIDNTFSVSSTDYGTSCYFTFYKNSESLDKMVVRISDHSVQNSYRMANERHERATTINVEKVANAIELYLHPERFQFTPKEIGFTHRINGVHGVYSRIN